MTDEAHRRRPAVFAHKPNMDPQKLRKQLEVQCACVYVCTQMEKSRKGKTQGATRFRKSESIIDFPQYFTTLPHNLVRCKNLWKTRPFTPIHSFKKGLKATTASVYPHTLTHTHSLSHTPSCSLTQLTHSILTNTHQTLSAHCLTHSLFTYVRPPETTAYVSIRQYALNQCLRLRQHTSAYVRAPGTKALFLLQPLSPPPHPSPHRKNPDIYSKISPPPPPKIEMLNLWCPHCSGTGCCARD
jgi:hypothetical protein